MKIALFGASGETGRLLTERCLDRGYAVKALVRSPEKFPFRDRVEVVHGDATSAEMVDRTVDESDVVLSALGARSLKREDVLERAVPLIVEAMTRRHVRRVIVLGGSSALSSSLDRQPPVMRWLIQHILYDTLLKWPSTSQRCQYATLSATDLEWTMVMPPMLTNGRAGGEVRVDPTALPYRGMRICRADVADFMMAQIEGRQWVSKGVYIAR